MKATRPNAFDSIYREIAAQDWRKLNWRAMKHFVKKGLFQEAALCRDRVVRWNSKGPT